MKKTTIAWGMAGAVWLAGCGVGGTKTGNPDQVVPDVDAEIEVELRAWSSEESVASLPEGQQALTQGAALRRMLLSVYEVRLVEAIADGACSGAVDGPVIDGARAIDLLRGEALPPLTVAKKTRFCGLRLSLQPGSFLEERSEEAELLGDASIFIEGSRADGTPFIVHSRGVREILLRSQRAFGFTEDERWFVAFDAARMFAPVDLEGAEVEGGLILISGYQNYEQLVQFEEVAPRSVNACLDDEDGALDEACRAPVLGEPPGA
ncbi:hypothetical protein [Vulgatibacter sp.]|uniref:hypothetical protein n=1 Tax=Vulgatibacter sp. TaxID=1971226 RepID=UPI003566B76E